MIEVLSLGAGVQSTTVALMSCRGELPKLDCAIFADTGWEPKAVYKHLEWLTEYCRPHFPVHRVANGNIKTDALTAQVRGQKANGHRWASMPYFTMEAGSKREGMIQRQCTSDYKITPIDRFLRRELLGLKPRQRAPKEQIIRHWFGISFDEWERSRTTANKWERNWYPLIEGRISRAGCLEWMMANGFPEPPRSACIGCPFHTNSEWRRLKNEDPDEFEDACQFDEMIRDCGGMRGQLFLHRSCRPLREIDFRNDFDRGQLSLLPEEAACDGGHCFV